MIGKADETVGVAIDLVSPHDGERPLPPALAAIVAAGKPGGGGGSVLEEALRAALESTDPPADAWEGPGRDFYAAWSLPLDQEVVLSTGRRATIRDLLTIQAYDQFNHVARLHQEEAKARAAKPD